MSSERKYNSKGQLIEELDVEPITSLKRVRPEISSLEQSAKKLKQVSATEPFLKMNEEEILAWCEAYLSLKSRGINIYKI